MEDYTSAAAVVEKVLARQGSIKSLSLADDVVNKRKTFALATESMRHVDSIRKVISKSQLMSKEGRLTESLAIVLVYDLLFSKRLRKTRGWMKDAVCRNRKDLLKAAQELGLDLAVTAENARSSTNVDGAAAVLLPRFVRVNLLRTSVTAVVDHFVNKNGFKFLGVAPSRDTVPEGKVFYSDIDLPELLLVFPPKTELHEHELLKRGSIVVQDKSSCLPIHILDPPPGAVCVDTCSAPGNKTSQLAARVGAEGLVYAYERDLARSEVLRSTVKRLNCRNVRIRHADAMGSTPTPWPRKATYAVVDPTCSGSAPDADEARIASLAEFQYLLLQHVMKQPRIKHIVYSTCSSSATENENVVARVLASDCKFRLVHAMPGWSNRGMTGFNLSNEDCEKVIRASRNDLTRDFFVALFERAEQADLTADGAVKLSIRRGSRVMRKTAPKVRSGLLRGTVVGKAKGATAKSE